MDGNEFALLGNFADREADIIESVLRQLDIPVLKKYPDSGGYLEIYSGTSLFGVSLYVPESQLDEAKQIIENSDNEVDEDNVNGIDYEEMAGEEQEAAEPENETDSTSFLGVFRIIAKVSITAMFIYYLIIYLLQLFK